VSLDYQIVVPSRRRAHNMRVIRELLPTASICIDERERADYASEVPADKLLVHPPMDGWIALRHELDDGCGAGADPGGDRRRLCRRAGDGWIEAPHHRSRRYPGDHRECGPRLLRPAIAFCWARSANATITKPDMRPIMATQPVCNAFGIMGAARHRKYDPSLLGRADVDWALRTLLEDRCVYADVRFYFDCGAVFSGRGGNVGLVTPELFERASRGLIRKWGKCVSFKPLDFQKRRQVSPVKMVVSRTNKTAQK
jgi:hypothetical protein